MTEKPEVPRTPEGLALIPSVLLAETLADFQAAEASDDYIIDMGQWHVPIIASKGHEGLSGVCIVCFAGAAMAGTMEVPMGERCTPYQFGSATESLLIGLDAAREFQWYQFMHQVQDARDAMGMPRAPDGFFGELDDMPTGTGNDDVYLGFVEIMQMASEKLRARGH